MRKLLTLIAIILGLVARAAIALDIKGIALGQEWNPDVIEKAFNDHERAHMMCTVHRCQGVAFVGSCLMTTADVYHEAGAHPTVTGVMMTFSPDCFESLLPLLLKKYGTPTTTRNVEKQNTYAKVADKIIIWTRGKQILEVEKYETFANAKLHLRR
jgi:hypothetical protein